MLSSSNRMRERSCALKFRSEGRLHGAAAFVSKHHKKLRLEGRTGVLEAAHDLGRHNIARDANDEQVAEAPIENQLRRYPRVAAAQDGRVGSLALGEIGENLLGPPRKARLTPQETGVPLHQARERVVRVDRAIIAVVDGHRASAVRAGA
jgi:hypothetical protein